MVQKIGILEVQTMDTLTAFPTILPISDLRQNTASILQEVQEKQEPVVITQRGRPVAVVIDFESYEDLFRKLEIMRMLMRSEEDINSGRLVDSEIVHAESKELLGR